MTGCERRLMTFFCFVITKVRGFVRKKRGREEKRVFRHFLVMSRIRVIEGGRQKSHSAGLADGLKLEKFWGRGAAAADTIGLKWLIFTCKFKPRKDENSYFHI